VWSGKDTPEVTPEVGLIRFGSPDKNELCTFNQKIRCVSLRNSTEFFRKAGQWVSGITNTGPCVIFFLTISFPLVGVGYTSSWNLMLVNKHTLHAVEENKTPAKANPLNRLTTLASRS